MIYLLADSENGVYQVETLDELTSADEVMSQQDFYDELAGVKPGQVIGADVDCEMYSKIDAEYGITFIQ